MRIPFLLNLPVCSEVPGPTVHPALLWELPSTLSICERSGNRAQDPVHGAISDVPTSLGTSIIIPVPALLVLIGSGSWRVSITFWNNIHRGLGFVWPFPRAQTSPGTRLSQRATSSSGQPSLSSTPRLSTSSPSPVRQTLPRCTLEYKPLSGILPSPPPFMCYVRTLAAQNFQVYPGPYRLEIPLDLPPPFPRAGPWTGRRLHRS